MQLDPPTAEKEAGNGGDRDEKELGPVIGADRQVPYGNAGVPRR